MAASSGIGLYLGEDQLRVVKLRRTSRGVTLQRLGNIPTPAGAISGGVPLDVRLLSESIRRLLKAYDVTGHIAAVGLPGRAATSRVLDLPTMSREEQRAVVAGEMEHYRMIPPGQGTFDFISLDESTEGGQARTRLLLMAADKRIVDNYREALRLAGLQMSLLEPFSLAATRATFPSLGEESVGILTVGARNTELAILDNSVLRYARQIDIGSLNLTEELTSEEIDQDTAPAAAAQPADTPAEGPQIPRLQATSSNLASLLYEAQRSLDFYHREAPNAPRVERIILCADTDQLSGLDKYLENQLGLPVAVSEPFRGIHYSDAQFNPDYLARVGAGFTPAVGLALRALGEIPEAAHMDLSVTGPESRLAKSAPKRLTWALAISVLFLLGALITAWQLRNLVTARENELAAAQQELDHYAQVAQEYTTAAKRVQEAQEIVQMRGLPWSDILQQVAEFMPHGSWLSNLSTDATNMLSLEGGAMSADSVATLMDSLTLSPLFAMPHMTYIKKDTSKAVPIVKFQIKVLVRQPQQAPPAAEPVPPGGKQ